MLKIFTQEHSALNLEEEAEGLLDSAIKELIETGYVLARAQFYFGENKAGILTLDLSDASSKEASYKQIEDVCETVSATACIIVMQCFMTTNTNTDIAPSEAEDRREGVMVYCEGHADCIGIVQEYTRVGDSDAITLGEKIIVNGEANILGESIGILHSQRRVAMKENVSDDGCF